MIDNQFMIMCIMFTINRQILYTLITLLPLIPLKITKSEPDKDIESHTDLVPTLSIAL